MAVAQDTEGARPQRPAAPAPGSAGELAATPLFRVWLVAYRDWQPVSWRDVPPECQTLEPAEADCLPADMARRYLKNFNKAMLRDDRHLWALAVPITIRFDGDLECGRTVREPSCPFV